MMAGISEILLISTPQDLPKYRDLFGSGEKFGLSIEYLPQESPDGLPQAFTIAESFIGDSNVALILGDNLFFGEGFREKLLSSATRSSGATLFGYRVKDPERYGVVEFNEEGEKGQLKKSHQTLSQIILLLGLYFYDSKVVEYAKSLEKSKRGEYEITDLNKIYLNANNLHLETLGRGFVWLDAGTHESQLTLPKLLELFKTGTALN